MAKATDLLNRPNNTFVEYTTNLANKSISAPGANTWFDLPDVTVTVPEDGTYIINCNARIWQDTTSDAKWKKHRILVNGDAVDELTWFGRNPSDIKTNLDSTHSFQYIYRLNKNDVLQVQGYIGINQSGDVKYSNVDGSVTLQAIKIGD